MLGAVDGDRIPSFHPGDAVFGATGRVATPAWPLRVGTANEALECYEALPRRRTAQLTSDQTRPLS